MKGSYKSSFNINTYETSLRNIIKLATQELFNFSETSLH